MIDMGNPWHVTVLTTHIGAASVALVAGFGALAFRKGGRLHRLAGNVFFPAIVVMLALGGALFVIKGSPGAAVGVAFGIYLAATAWITARAPDGLGRYGLAVALFGAGIVAIALLGAVQGMNSPNRSVVGALIFAVLGALAVGRDVKALAGKGIFGAPRIRRHIWRMCAVLFFASGSFFLGQQDEFPKAIQGPIWFVPAFAPLALMVFWMIRTRGPKKRGPLIGSAAEAAA